MFLQRQLIFYCYTCSIFQFVSIRAVSHFYTHCRYCRSCSSCNNCNNNDATITQSGSGNKDGDIEFKNNPSDNSTVNLTQSGDGAHVGNIRVEQGNYTVNATQTGTTVKNYTVTLDCTANCNKTVTVNQFD